MYEYINLEVKKLKAINSLMNDEVDNYIEFVDELEDLETAKSLILDLLISMRENANLLNMATTDLNKINKCLTKDKKLENKKRRLNFRYE